MSYCSGLKSAQHNIHDACFCLSFHFGQFEQFSFSTKRLVEVKGVQAQNLCHTIALVFECIDYCTVKLLMCICT